MSIHILSETSLHIINFYLGTNLEYFFVLSGHNISVNQRYQLVIWDMKVFVSVGHF